MPARILIIEDHPFNLELMAVLLKASGHRTLAAEDGETGLVIARRERPDLILCDIRMPGIDGYGVVRELKAGADTREIPVVAVTAYAMVGDRDMILAHGFNGYIAKPLNPEIFVAQAEAFLPASLRGTPPDRAGSSAAAPPATARRATILVVDDAPINLSLQRSILEPLGFTVWTAANITQALLVAQQYPPDLIVSDLNMRDGDGFEFIRAVKAQPQLQNIPFVFITSTFCDPVSRDRGLALGAARFLFRPIEPPALVSVLETCLREHLQT